ncbi:MAG: phosphotransferase family protein, partial [Sciscionella sp.]
AEAAADGIPVPQVLAEDAHSAVLSYVEGERADIVLRRSTEREREQIGEALGAAFAAVWARPRAVAGIPQVHEGEVTVEPVRPSPAAQFEDFLDRARHAPPGWSALARRYAEAMHYLGQRPVRCHGDANGKNVILHRGVGPGAAGGRWSVAAIVDWEFTWAGPLEADLGNLLRFESVFEKLSPLRRGLVRAAGVTREQVELARRLDLFAMAEMFARPRMAGPVLRQLRTVAGAQVAAGRV